MKYYRIDTERDPSITGSKNGVYSVEIKDKYSYLSIEDKKNWENYCSLNRKERNRVMFDSYIPIDDSKIKDYIVFFPVGKKVKLLDFMAFAPFEHGIQFLVSQRIYSIFSKFRLPVHNKVPAKINGFEEPYFLIGFPMLKRDAFDFKHSVFMDYTNGIKVAFGNAQEYETLNMTGAYIVPQKIVLKDKLSLDIIETIEGTFFSSELIKELEKEKITGYKIKEGILEN